MIRKLGKNIARFQKMMILGNISAKILRFENKGNVNSELVNFLSTDF
jgi:hypothetical protein